MAQGTLWGYTGVMLGEDEVIVALFSLFTIALIPIFWIYRMASRAARWVVVSFALFSLWLYIRNPAYIPAALLHDPMELAAPLLKIMSIALLFTPSANAYFRHWKGGADAEEMAQ